MLVELPMIASIFRLTTDAAPFAMKSLARSIGSGIKYLLKLIFILYLTKQKKVSFLGLTFSIVGKTYGRSRVHLQFDAKLACLSDNHHTLLSEATQSKLDPLESLSCNHNSMSALSHLAKDYSAT